VPAPVPITESKRLEALRRFRILDTPSEAAFDDFVLIASEICGTPISLVSLIDADRQWFKARLGLDSCGTPREQSFCAHAVASQSMFVVEDAHKDPRFATNPLVSGAPHIRFYAGAPLVTADGHALGTICVIDSKPRRLSAKKRAALAALAQRVMSALEYRLAAAELATALEEVKVLSGLLPICSHCKSIRDDAGYWSSLERYFQTQTDARFSHGICPGCLEVEHPAVLAKMRAAGKI
jgi:GAF domain-containing protein